MRSSDPWCSRQASSSDQSSTVICYPNIGSVYKALHFLQFDILNVKYNTH